LNKSEISLPESKNRKKPSDTSTIFGIEEVEEIPSPEKSNKKDGLRINLI
jgi:hypothetical protein